MGVSTLEQVPTVKEPTEPIERGVSVLMVDRSNSVLRVMRDTIGNLPGVNFQTCATGEGAIGIMRERKKEGKPFDVVFTSLDTGDISGLSLAETANREWLSHVYLMKEELQQIPQENLEVSGVIGVLTKPDLFEPIAKIISDMQNPKDSSGGQR